MNKIIINHKTFEKLFTSILTLLDSVSAKMKASRTKPKQIWIGITSKGMGLFTGLPSKKKVQPVVPTKGKAKAGKPQAGKPQAGKQPVQLTGAFGKNP